MPERFDPFSKFYLKPNGEARSKFAHLPFGNGARACPGQFLAYLEMKIFLIFFVKHKAWNWDLIDDEYKDVTIPTFAYKIA